MTRMPRGRRDRAGEAAVQLLNDLGQLNDTPGLGRTETV